MLFVVFLWFLRGRRPLGEGEADAEGKSRVITEEALSQEAGRGRIRAHRWGKRRDTFPLKWEERRERGVGADKSLILLRIRRYF